MIVYTCITNQKDRLLPVSAEPGVQFICFSDQPIKHPVWKWCRTDNLGQQDPRRVARRYKILSHLYFPGEDTIWVDGRVKLLRPVQHYFDKYQGMIAARPHHDRQCVYQEAEQVKKIRYDDPSTVDDHIQRIKDTGYPPLNGLHETGMVLRRPGCQNFNNLWWSLLSTGSKRDQLSFDFCLWQLGIKCADVDRSEVQVFRHKRQTNAQT